MARLHRHFLLLFYASWSCATRGGSPFPIGCFYKSPLRYCIGSDFEVNGDTIAPRSSNVAALFLHPFPLFSPLPPLSLYLLLSCNALVIFEKIDFQPRFDCLVGRSLNPERVNVISIITWLSWFLITYLALTQNYPIRIHQFTLREYRDITPSCLKKTISLEIFTHGFCKQCSSSSVFRRLLRPF